MKRKSLDVVSKAIGVLPLVFALGIAPAFAKPIVISELGESPLLGQSTSTAEMQERVARNEGIVSAAAVKIGLTPGEYAQFHAAIDSSRVAWVTVPRHLDAMSWQSGGTVYVLHDVEIPAGSHGWEVDVRSHDQILSLYMPAKCGNLSIVRKAAPVVAVRPAPRRVAALAVAPPVAVAPVVAAPVEVAPLAVAPAPVVVPNDEPVAPPATVAETEFPPAAAAATHRAPFFLLVPILAALAALSGGSGSGPVVPVPAGCP